MVGETKEPGYEHLFPRFQTKNLCGVLVWQSSQYTMYLIYFCWHADDVGLWDAGYVCNCYQYACANIFSDYSCRGGLSFPRRNLLISSCALRSVCRRLFTLAMCVASLTARRLGSSLDSLGNSWKYCDVCGSNDIFSCGVSQNCCTKKRSLVVFFLTVLQIITQHNTLQVARVYVRT